LNYCSCDFSELARVCVIEVINLSPANCTGFQKRVTKYYLLYRHALKKGHSKSAPAGLQQSNTSVLVAMEAVRQATVSVVTILHGEPNKKIVEVTNGSTWYKTWACQVPSE